MFGDKFGYSPDIGYFVERDGKAYSEHGFVFDVNNDLFRSLPIDSVLENYADWTDEQRAVLVDRKNAEYEENRKRRDAHAETVRALVESARQKLTEEEFDAVLHHMGDDD